MLKSRSLWLPDEATDGFIYDVCRKAGLEGYGLLPSPLESAFESRNFLIAFVSGVSIGEGKNAHT